MSVAMMTMLLYYKYIIKFTIKFTMQWLSPQLDKFLSFVSYNLCELSSM